MATRKTTTGGQVLRKVANPTPPILMLLNPKGVKKMAVRKTTRRRKSTRTNPTRQATTHHKSAATRTRKRTARKNPLIVYRSKRNPSHGHSEILEFTVAGLVLGIVTPIVSPIVGRFAPGRFAAPAGAAVGGVGLSYLFGMFPATKRFSRPAWLLGFSTAAIALIAPIIRQWMAPAPQAAASGMNGGYYGMNGIGIMPGVPNRSGPQRPQAIAAPRPAAAGMAGVGAWSAPGRFR